MSDVQHELDSQELQELLQEEFNPELFYKALSNALAQLEQYDVEAA
ncbi:MAG: hypothetical protein AAF993_17060 [Pseudomonadota bacterium]